MEANPIVKCNVASRSLPSISISVQNDAHPKQQQSFLSDLFLRSSDEDSFRKYVNTTGLTTPYPDNSSFLSSVSSMDITHQCARSDLPTTVSSRYTEEYPVLKRKFYQHIYNISQALDYSADVGRLDRRRYNTLSSRYYEMFPSLPLQYVDITYTSNPPQWMQQQVQSNKLRVDANLHQIYDQIQCSRRNQPETDTSSVLSTRMQYISAICPVTLAPATLQTAAPIPSSVKGDDDDDEVFYDSLLSSRECIAVGGCHSVSILPYSPASLRRRASGPRAYSTRTPIYFRATDLHYSSDFITHNPNEQKDLANLDANSSSSSNSSMQQEVPPPVHFSVPGFTSCLAVPCEFPHGSQPMSSRLYSSHYTGHIYWHDLYENTSTLIHKLQSPVTQFVCGKEQFATCIAVASQGIHMIDYRSKKPVLMLLSDNTTWKKSIGTYLNVHPRIYHTVTTQTVAHGGDGDGDVGSSSSRHHHLQQEQHAPISATQRDTKRRRKQDPAFPLIPWSYRKKTRRPDISLSAGPRLGVAGMEGLHTQLHEDEESYTITTIKAHLALDDYQLPSTTFTVEWNPYREYQIASGGVEGLSIYDIRMGKELHRYRVCDKVYSNTIVRQGPPLSLPSEQQQQQHGQRTGTPSGLPRGDYAVDTTSNTIITSQARSATPITNIHYINNGQQIVATTLTGDVLLMNILSIAEEMHAKTILHGQDLNKSLLASHIRYAQPPISPETQQHHQDDGEMESQSDSHDDTTRGEDQLGDIMHSNQRSVARKLMAFGLPHVNATNYTDCVLPLLIGARQMSHTPFSMKMPLFRSSLLNGYLFLPNQNNVGVISLHNIKETVYPPPMDSTTNGTAVVDESLPTPQPVVVTLSGTSSPVLCVAAVPSNLQNTADVTDYISTVFAHKEQLGELCRDDNNPRVVAHPHRRIMLPALYDHSLSTAAFPSVVAGCTDGSMLTWAHNAS